MSERENILGRIREALKIAAPAPGGHDHGAVAPTAHGAHSVVFKPRAAASHAREWLPKVGPSFEEQVELFKAHSLDLKSDFHLLAGQAEVASVLGRLRDAGGWKRVAFHPGELTNLAIQALGLPALKMESGYDVNDLEGCDVGITECDALIAQTGSVLITSRSAGGRALSVLPPHHLVLARRDQLLPDLPSAFELLSKRYGASFPSFMSVITGPSRTGDIERILVLGAHGPKELTILCL